MEKDSLELMLGLRMYYKLQTDPNEYFAKRELDFSDSNMKPKLNTHASSENILDLLKNFDYQTQRIPTREMMKVLNKEVPDPGVTRTEEEIQKELDSDTKSLQESIESEPMTNEEKEKKYIESGDVQSMLEYMRIEAKKRGFDLNAKLDSYMAGLMILQLAISMFDSTQVLSDYLVERLLNQGILAKYIEEFRDIELGDFKDDDFYMSLTTFPSSLVAKLMYDNSKEVLKRKGTEITPENILNLLNTWTEDEKWEIEHTAFLGAKGFLKFINNNNEIRYSGNPQIGITSNIKKIEYENPKMMVKPGGSGLLEIRKI
jgi:hypothetical protein